MKRMMVCLLAVLLLTGGVRVQARTDELSRAWRTAAIYVPGSAMPEGMEDRGEVLAFLFVDEQKQHSYEVLIGRGSTAFLQRTLVAYARTAAKQVALKDEDIRAQVKEEYPDAGIDGVFIRQEEGLYGYLAIFTRAQDSRLHRGFYNARDGELLVDVMWPVGPAEGFLSLKQAKEIILKLMCDEGVLSDIRVERIGAGVLYLMNISLEGEDRAFTIDARTGKVLGGVTGAELWRPAAVAAATPRPVTQAPDIHIATSTPAPDDDDDDDNSDNDTDDSDDDDVPDGG